MADVGDALVLQDVRFPGQISRSVIDFIYQVRDVRGVAPAQSEVL